GSRFNIQSPSVFFRVVLQVKRKPDHPISFFPVSLAAALLFPRGRILVPAPKTVEDGIRFRHEHAVFSGQCLEQTEESLVKKQPANLRIAGEDIYQAALAVAR